MAVKFTKDFPKMLRRCPKKGRSKADIIAYMIQLHTTFHIQVQGENNFHLYAT